ncbi:hypothetical protein AB4242_22695 [Vibrio splendidus]|jgi:hypothetical protein|uniref:hypothetical protein n=1 Tax=Vibrio splendidus TaxID=29497 RepID=UPI000CC57A56|nr:hypothetical protein [Vibrio splendidus]MCC4790768.1 hypothetical protein [Vibrio splendidus]MCC4863646.1 hypothetical protein [Vibrio splendidus]MDH5938632.1 hypothetical protein [Vibrio splendidus]MDP2589919.1 hypothetical protein [Vibrio splendidus]PMG61518.1 hypothetical protein BCU89_25730 [Vibrio splendidus]
MRQKIGIDQLNQPITNEDVELAIANAGSTLTLLDELPVKWLDMCNEKLSLASETLDFLLKQRLQIHKRGYPSVKLEYLALAERQIKDLTNVYLSFYRLAPGLIHQLKQSEPTIYAWLMLSSELGQEHENLLCGLSMLDELDYQAAKLLVVQSSLRDIDLVIIEMVEGGCKLPLLYLECLQLRQTVTVGLLKRWLKDKRFSKHKTHLFLSLQNDVESVVWLAENSKGSQNLFERLLSKEDRGTWFRKEFGTSIDSVFDSEVVTFAKLLELKEFGNFDPSSVMAPFDFVLHGLNEHVPQIVDLLFSLDEFEGEDWIQALYIVYGKRLPVTPKNLGIDFEWHEMLEKLKQWAESDAYRQVSPGRMGQPLTLETSIQAMFDTQVSAAFRIWIWRQVCLHTRSYIPWDMTMPAHQQKWNITRLTQNSTASERFGLRSNHAVVGY